MEIFWKAVKGGFGIFHTEVQEEQFSHRRDATKC